MQAGIQICCERRSERSGFGAPNMDFILSSIIEYDQPLDHEGELLQVSSAPGEEHHRIGENHEHHPLPLSLIPPSNQKEDSHLHDYHLMSPSQIDFRQLKRKASISSGEINENPKESKKGKKIMHRDIERQRRQEMATLYASLRSHLPLEYLKGKRSISDHVYQAANYIKHIQKNIEELQKKRDELKKQRNSSGSSTGAVEKSQCPAIMGDTVMLVRPGCIGMEVFVNTPLKQGLPLSRMIGILVAEGLSIVSCNSAERNQRLLYTLESEVSNGEIIDIPELQHRLIAKCTSEPGFK